MTEATSDADDDRPKVGRSGADGPDSPEWGGIWRVRRYGGSSPSVPTYYRATRESWDVVKDVDSGRHVARHPVLKVDESRIVLKDEGAPDDDAEEWRVRVREGTLRVTALTGPHEGVVGVAEPLDELPAR